MTSAISIENLSKTFRSTPFGKEVRALVDVSLEVGAGEAFGFVGHNGAGKSTTIKVLMGILRATSGSARLFGIDVSAPEARKGLGYVPENPLLYDYLTPVEILTSGLHLHGVSVDDERRYCLEWLERFDIAHVADRRLRTFSKGMVQRTALAHALAIKPRLLILDEPLSGLDPVGRRDVVDILAEYRRSGGTIFFTSHVLHDVERLADRFGLVAKGRMRAVSSPGELAGDEDLVTVRSLGDAAVPGFVAQVGRQWQAEIPKAQLWPTLEQLRGAGHDVIEIKPTLNLESAFLRYQEQEDR